MDIAEIREALSEGKTRFTYEVSYGFVGGSRPMSIELSFTKQDLEDLTDDELYDQIDEAIRESFMQRAEFDITGVRR